MMTVVQDLRQAVRGFARHPGFTVTAVAILGLGLGVNTAIFTIYNRVGQANVDDPKTVVRLARVSGGERANRFSYPDYRDLRDSTTTVRELIGSVRELVHLTGVGAANAAPRGDAAGRGRGREDRGGGGAPAGGGGASGNVAEGGGAGDGRSVGIVSGPASGLIPAAFVTGNYAAALGGRAAIGRTLLPADDRADADTNIVVLGYNLWQRQFDRDPGVLGRTIVLNNQRLTIVGVMARGFTGLAIAPAGVWLPIGAYPRFMGDAERLHRRDARWLDVAGRLAPGATTSQAEAELTTIAAGLARAYPDASATGVTAVRSSAGTPSGEAGRSGQPSASRSTSPSSASSPSGSSASTPSSSAPSSSASSSLASAPASSAAAGVTRGDDVADRMRIVVMSGARGETLGPEEQVFAALILTATTMVLAIACANLAGVLLARSVARQKELGVRLSLGATRGRLLRQLLTESGLLACAGGVAGLLLASWIAPLILLLALPSELRLWAPDLTPDAGVFGFALLLAGLATLLFGALPGLHATRVDIIATLGAGATLFGHHVRRTRLLNGLVSVQMALALVLLVSAALLVRGLLRVSAIDPGFAYERLLFVEMELTREASATPTAPLLIARAAEAVRRLPGVTAVSVAGLAPLGASSATLLWRDSQRRPWFEIRTNDVSANFFETMGIPLVRGRSFTADEVRTGAPLVIVNDALARRLWPDRDPIGQEMIFPPTYDTRATVIGVTPDARTASLSGLTPALLYRPLAPQSRTRVALAARTAVPPETLRTAADQAVRLVDPRLSIDHVDTGAHNVERWIRPARLGSALASALGGLALLLTLVGVYGVVSFAVRQRTRELAVRMALGAERRDILALVLRQAIVPMAIGLAAGGLGLSFFTPLLRSQLHGLSPFDPVTFAGVSIAVMTATLAAIYAPARAATRLDPVATLRRD